MRLPMIEAVKAGADVYVQKPISIDVTEGQAMLAAARKYKRVVQVGMQRRSTPHLVDRARSHHPRRQAREDRATSRSTATTTCARRRIRPTQRRPSISITRCGPGPAPMRPYNKLVHPRSWRAFMEYGNGIVGDMCVHMLDMVRWMLDLGMPTRISSTGGILVDKASKANITDTQEATFDFGDLKVVWAHRIVGRSARSEVSVGRNDLRRQGHAQSERLRLRFHSGRRRRRPCTRTCATSSSSSPRTRPKRTSRSTWRRRSART